MISVKITIKPHLAEYLIGKYNNHDTSNPIQFSDNLDLYHTIYDLSERCPANVRQIDVGNLWFYLPERENGKSTQVFNYFGRRSVELIEERIEAKFWADIHDYMDYEKHMNGVDFKDSAHIFMTKYGIESITIDALLKNYQRWRDKCRNRKKRRKYSANKVK